MAKRTEPKKPHHAVPHYGNGKPIGRKSDLDYQLEDLRNKHWRLNNLYLITDKNGRRRKFKMTKEQLEYFEGMHTRNIILKARQLGFTTEQCILQLDAALFEGAKCALIAHTLPDARRLFREKIKFAYDNLPKLIKEANPAKNDAAGELVFSRGGSLYVSTSFRGGTLKYLHISEFGKICAKYPDKAREIVTGALEAVSKDCTATIESTAEGRAGYFFTYCEQAKKMRDTKRSLSSLDWKFFFFPWFTSDDYQLPPGEDQVSIPNRLTRYFSGLEQKLGVKISRERRLWYASKERTLGEDMKREYPSTPEEAFAQTLVGAYYAKQFAFLYANDRFIPTSKMPDNTHVLVNTYWDIGVGDDTSIWFVRQVGNEFHVIDHYSNSGEGLRHYMTVLKERADKLGYRYGEHWAPHDIDNREFGSDGKSRRDIAKEGYTIDGHHYTINFKVVPRVSVDDGIEAVREILPHCVFDADKCGLNESGQEGPGSHRGGLVNLESYRKEWDERRGCWKDKPLHDASSHDADSFRYFAVVNNKRDRKVKITNPIGLAR